MWLAGDRSPSNPSPNPVYLEDFPGEHLEMTEHETTSDFSRPVSGQAGTYLRTSPYKLNADDVQPLDSRRLDAPGPDDVMTQSSEAPLGSVLGPRRPRVKKLWQQRFVKLLVIGDSGLGKTTLIRSLLAVPGEQVELHDGSETLFSEFQKDPEQFLSSVSWEDADDCIKWVYQIQDTPGYGDDLNLMHNINRVREYLNNQNRKWLEMETSAKRSDMAEVVDPRVDLVIFCLPPHRIRNIDLLFMWEVSQIVPILPVVMKSDTMTIKEASSYRQSVYRRLEHPGLVGRRGPVKLFHFTPETMDAVGCPDPTVSHEDRPPYLVVCSNEYNKQKMTQEVPELWPERCYMWGTTEAYNPKHSDLLLLRRLLLQEGVEEIFLSKRKRYEAWRRKEMSSAKPLAFLGRFVLNTVVTAVVLLSIVHATGQVDLRKVLRKTRKAVQEAAIVPDVIKDAVKDLGASQTEDKTVAEAEKLKDEAEQAKARVPAKAQPAAPSKPKTFSLFG